MHFHAGGVTIENKIEISAYMYIYRRGRVSVISFLTCGTQRVQRFRRHFFSFRRKRTPGNDCTGESPRGWTAGYRNQISTEQTRREAKRARKERCSEESTDESHTVVLRVALIRGGNFVTRRARAAPRRATPHRFESRIVLWELAPFPSSVARLPF